MKDVNVRLTRDSWANIKIAALRVGKEMGLKRFSAKELMAVLGKSPTKLAKIVKELY